MYFKQEFLKISTILKYLSSVGIINTPVVVIVLWTIKKKTL